MKKNQILFLLLSFFACITTVNAAKSSGPFYIKGGIVGPKQQFELEIKLNGFTTINNFAVFDLTCYIENTNYAKPYPVVLKLTYNTYGSDDAPTPTFNDHPIVANQVKLDQLNNVFEVKRINIYKNNDPVSKIWFENLDTTDAVTIQRCIATYTT